MQEAYKIVAANAKKRTDRGKKYYYLKAKNVALVPGDRVLMKNVCEKGGLGKLCSYSEDKVHIVLRRINGDLPVYEIRPENGKTRVSSLHRNLLFHCIQLEGYNIREPSKKKGRKRLGQRQQRESTSERVFEYPLRWVGNLHKSNPSVEDFTSSETIAEIEPVQPEAATELVSTNESLESDAVSDHAGSSSLSVSAEEQIVERRPQRQRQQTHRLTYDSFGEPVSCQETNEIKAEWDRWHPNGVYW